MTDNPKKCSQCGERMIEEKLYWFCRDADCNWCEWKKGDEQ